MAMRKRSKARAQAQTGMELRDVFAAFALAGTLANPENEINAGDEDDVARDCYDFADALVRARGEELEDEDEDDED